eukprot:5676873-Karenia_brevis.AAC.1
MPPSSQSILISVPSANEYLRALAIRWDNELPSRLGCLDSSGLVAESQARWIDSGENKLNEEDSALVDSIIRCCQDQPIRLGISAMHGRRIIGVGIASQKKRRVQATKLALRLLFQDDWTCTDPTLHTEATIEGSLARKPTSAEQDIDKTFAVLVRDWGDIRSFFFDSEAEALHRFEQFQRIGRLSLQLRGEDGQTKTYLVNKQAKKDFDMWWQLHKMRPGTAAEGNNGT